MVTTTGNATTALLAAFRRAYTVETHVTGGVTITDPLKIRHEIDAEGVDRMAMSWDGTADGLEDLGWGSAAEALRRDAETAAMFARADRGCPSCGGSMCSTMLADPARRDAAEVRCRKERTEDTIRERYDMGPGHPEDPFARNLADLTRRF